jgi:hypothetical protein
LASSIFRQVEKTLEAEANRVREAVVSGACEDFPAYKYAIGRIVGVQFAIDTLKEMEEAALKADGDF